MELPGLASYKQGHHGLVGWKETCQRITVPYSTTPMKSAKEPFRKAFDYRVMDHCIRGDWYNDRMAHYYCIIQWLMQLPNFRTRSYEVPVYNVLHAKIIMYTYTTFCSQFIYPGRFTLSYKASSHRLPELVFWGYSYFLYIGRCVIGEYKLYII